MGCSRGSDHERLPAQGGGSMSTTPHHHHHAVVRIDATASAKSRTRSDGEK